MQPRAHAWQRSLLPQSERNLPSGFAPGEANANGRLSPMQRDPLALACATWLASVLLGLHDLRARVLLHDHYRERRHRRSV